MGNMDTFTLTNTVETDDSWIFDIELEGRSFRVELDNEYLSRLTGNEESPQALIRASFEFLLEREPASSILTKFKLSAIQAYFPDFEDTMQRRFSQ